MKALLASTLALLIVAAFAVETIPFARADTIYLRNGRILHGKIHEDARRKDSSRIIFRNGGHMVVQNADIKKSVKNDRGAFESRGEDAVPVPATAGTDKLVRVKMKRTKTEYYGSGSYVGWPKASADDSILVLGLPGGGELRIPKANIDTQEETDLREAGLAPAIEPDRLRVPTTHRITLTNGRVVIGNLMPTAEKEPLEIRVGRLGLLRFDRTRVERVDKIDGTYDLPEPGEETREAPAKKVDIPPEVIEQLKKELRREILRELIGGIIDDKLDATLLDAQSRGGVRLPVEPLGAKELLEAQFHVRELFRQGTRNRVRAESHLKRLGPGVLEFLGPAARHEFALTRRAVQRIVRDVGDFRGAPLAIEGLNDSDEHVRLLARDALQKLLHDVRIPYSPKGAEKSRLAAQAKYREAWLEIARLEAGSAVAARARELLDK